MTDIIDTEIKARQKICHLVFTRESSYCFQRVLSRVHSDKLNPTQLGSWVGLGWVEFTKCS